jgi:hypothetical protein
VDTPVALILFNRPDHVVRLIEALRPVRPRRLFVIADGPRPDRPGEADRCEAARRAVLEGVDWEAEILTEFSERNLGCRRRVSSGLDWVFSQVEEAIILEDDLVPHPDFFRYCGELLDRYRTEPRVGAISGDCFQPDGFDCGASYYFSVYPHCWGWATWRRAWAWYDHELAAWPAWRDSPLPEAWLGSPEEAAYWRAIFDRVHVGALDSWAFVWIFSLWRQGALTALPSRNLVSNLGFHAEATHTVNPDSPFQGLPVFPVPDPMVHPAAVSRHLEADAFSRTHVFGVKPSAPRSSAPAPPAAPPPSGFWKWLRPRP